MIYSAHIICTHFFNFFQPTRQSDTVRDMTLNKVDVPCHITKNSTSQNNTLKIVKQITSADLAL